MMTNKEKHVHLPDLPDEVIVKIMFRLPVKSLFRFTCVSKQWYSTIYDPQFGNSHFKLASEQGTLSQRLLLSSYPELEVTSEGFDNYQNFQFQPSVFQSSEPLETPLLGDNFPFRNLTFPSEERNQCVMGSCNGLVFLGEMSSVEYGEVYVSHYKNLSVWNPTTGFFRKVPCPDFELKTMNPIDMMSRLSGIVSYGFGHVLASDDYKIVFAIPSLHSVVNVYILSLKHNFWKVIEVPLSSFPNWMGGPGTFSNGALHWVFHRPAGVSYPAIHAFDLGKEEFRWVPLPDFEEHYERKRRVRTLVHKGGCLCIWSKESDSVIAVWVMREYGVHKSWVKLFEFCRSNLPDTHRLRLTFTTENGTVVIRLMDQGEVIRIECHDSHEAGMPVLSGRHIIQPGNDVFFDSTVYEETLVSLAE